MSSPESPWAIDATYDFLGTICRIRCSDLDFGRLVHRLFSDFPRSADETKTVFSVAVYDDSFQVTDDTGAELADGDRDEALMRLLQAVNGRTIEGLASLTVHAGAVAHNGNVLAFPGGAASGKSTLVAACLLQGFTYVTDEAVVIDPVFAELKPYPKPIWLSDVSRRLLGIDDTQLGVVTSDRFKSPVLAAELGSRVAARPLNLREVVMLDPTDEPSALEEADPSALAHTILEHAFNRFQEPKEWFHLAADLARGARSWRLQYGNPIEAATLLAETFH